MKATAKKISAKVNKKEKTVPSPPIQRTPKIDSPAPLKVSKSTPAPKKKASVAPKPARAATPTRVEKHQSKSIASGGGVQASAGSNSDNLLKLDLQFFASDVPKGAGKANSKEIFLDTASSHNSARKMLIDELDSIGAFKNGSNSYQGRLKSSYGYEKQIGRQSLDGKVRWRLDFDEKIGVHYNIEDFSKGKGVNAVKKVIPINISEQEYKKIIDLWNR